MLHEFIQCMNKCCLFFSDIQILITSLWYLQTLPTEYRRGNQEWTIQRNWLHWVHYTQCSQKQNKTQNRTLKNINTVPTKELGMNLSAREYCIPLYQ